MRSSRNIFIPVLLSTVVLVSACQTAPISGDTFARSEVGRAQTVRMGTVYSVRGVTIQSNASRTTTTTGAVLGGIGGSAIGGGTRANAAGAVAGAAAGAAIGNRVGSSSNQGVEVMVSLENGTKISVVQAGSPNDFRVGDQVRVTTDGTTTRVSR